MANEYDTDNSLIHRAAHWLHDVLRFFTESPSWLYETATIALLLTLFTSVILFVLMFRYQGKRPLDIALLCREAAFVFILTRLFLGFFLQAPFGWWSLGIYCFLFLSCLLIIMEVLHERRAITEADLRG